MKTVKKFNNCAFVTVMIALSGLGLPVTGLVNHFYGSSPMSVERHAWMSAHNSLGLLFVLFSIWHILNNRRSLWRHVKSSTTRVLNVSREAAVASAVVALTLVLFVGHAYGP